MHQSVETLGPRIGRYPGYNGGFHLVFASMSIHLSPLVRYIMRGLRVGWIWTRGSEPLRRLGSSCTFTWRLKKGPRRQDCNCLSKTKLCHRLQMVKYPMHWFACSCPDFTFLYGLIRVAWIPFWMLCLIEQEMHRKRIIFLFYIWPGFVVSL